MSKIITITCDHCGESIPEGYVSELTLKWPGQGIREYHLCTKDKEPSSCLIAFLRWIGKKQLEASREADNVVSGPGGPIRLLKIGCEACDFEAGKIISSLPLQHDNTSPKCRHYKSYIPRNCK